MAQVETDVVYGQVAERDLSCDIFRPDSPGEPAPAAILIHGGGWQRGNRNGVHPRARRLADHGIVAIAVEYRLTGEARWPGHIQDVKACLRWVRSHADSLGIHPDRIVLVGFSAGGHLALLAAGTPGDPTFAGDGGSPGVSEAVNAVVGFFPAIRIQPGDQRDNDAFPASPGSSLGDDMGVEEARAASPIERVREGYPPTLLLHGTADEVISPRASQQFYDRVIEAGSVAELRLYAGMRHEFVKIEEMLDLAMADVALFIRRTLVEPARFDIPQAELFSMPAVG
jgi:acetyl esterase/lipase